LGTLKEYSHLSLTHRLYFQELFVCIYSIIFLGKNEEAIKDYDEVIRLNPNHSSALNKRGSLKYSQNLFKEAIMDYDKVFHFILLFENEICVSKNTKINLSTVLTLHELNVSCI
jgi:tetratricopeptide (TPR) repeat protein